MTDLANGDLVTETHMDVLRGNIEYLLTPNSDPGVATGAADVTTTSTSWVAVNTTNWRKTITTNGGTVKIVASFLCKTTNNTDTVSFDIAVDGTRIGDATAGLTAYNGKGGAVLQHMTVVGITTPSAGSHNFDLYWKVSAATATLYNNTEPGNMFVIEG